MSESNGNGKLTVPEKMLALLADGMPHLRRDLHDCLYDDSGKLSNIQVHISNLRRQLRPRGQDIVCEITPKGIAYRQVRLLASPYDGRK